MSSANTNRETESFASGSPHKFRVLVMCEEDLDAAILGELFRLPDRAIIVCHNYIEFLLYLEHESFQLVMIFEGEKSPLGRSAAVAGLSKVHRDVSFQFIKRRAEDEFHTAALECPN